MMVKEQVPFRYLKIYDLRLFIIYSFCKFPSGRKLGTRLWACLIFVCFIISDAAVLKLKIAVSEEIQIHIAELTSREMKWIRNLGSKRNKSLLPVPVVIVLLIRITQPHFLATLHLRKWNFRNNLYNHLKYGLDEGRASNLAGENYD